MSVRPLSTGRDSRNRPHQVAEAIKQSILSDAMLPGDRLPQEPTLIERFQVSKGTVREALKILETQGIIRTRTGPGGGAFITDVPEELAGALLGNHFFFKDISIADIYSIRTVMEPQLAAEIASTITTEEIEQLKKLMTRYDSPAQSIEQAREQRQAELDFHSEMASFSKNPLLRFICRFMVRLLSDLAVCRQIYDKPNRELHEEGLRYQKRLIQAFEKGNPKTAKQILFEHMQTAQRLMLEQEAVIERGFLSDG